MDKKILEIVKKSLEKWPKELEKEIDFLKAFDGMVELNQELTKAKVEKSLDLVVGLAEKAYGDQTQEILVKSHGASALVSYREEDPSLQAELEKAWAGSREIDFSEYDEKKNSEEDGLEKGRGKDKQPRKKKGQAASEKEEAEKKRRIEMRQKIKTDREKRRPGVERQREEAKQAQQRGEDEDDAKDYAAYKRKFPKD